MLNFEDKILIKNLWECKRFSVRRLLREFPNKNWKRRTLDDFLRRLHTTGSIERKAGSGRPLLLTVRPERTRAADHSLKMLSTSGEIVWQPVCEKRVDILSTHSKNSLLGLVLALDGVEL